MPTLQRNKITRAQTPFLQNLCDTRLGLLQMETWHHPEKSVWSYWNRSKKEKTSIQTNVINFINKWQPLTNKARSTKSTLDDAKEREVSVDMMKKLTFPIVIQTTLRHDIVLSSEKSKAMVMIEVTVPWETRCDEAYMWRGLYVTRLMWERK